MKITSFNGSPWGRQGHTYIMKYEFLFGAQQAGAKIQDIQLVEKKITACNGCGVCFYKTPGKCVFKDDMEGLIHQYLSSDVVILVTPLHMDNVSTLMKAFMDRLIPMLEPHLEKDSQGQYRRGIRSDKQPKLLVMSGCAMPEHNQFEALQFFFRRFARTMHTEIVGEIYRPEAGLLHLASVDIQFSAAVEEYRELLRAAGKEFVETGEIRKELSDRLRKSLIKPDRYAEYANNLWDRLLPKRTFMGVPVDILEKKNHKNISVEPRKSSPEATE